MLACDGERMKEGSPCMERLARRCSDDDGRGGVESREDKDGTDPIVVFTILTCNPYGSILSGRPDATLSYPISFHGFPILFAFCAHPKRISFQFTSTMHHHEDSSRQDVILPGGRVA